MHKWLLFLAVLAAARADDAVLALTIRAQADFDRVEAEPFPGIQDVTRCSQTQAQLLPVARPAELPLVRFRKGYCELLEARMTRHRGDYQRAAQDFAQALAAWPARGVEPLSSGLQVLSAVARLEAGADAAERDGIRAGLRDALSREACPAGVMSARFCQELVRTGRLWQGWMALGDGDSRAAEEIFREFPDLAWSAWMAGRQALREHRYTQAAAAFRKTVEAWSREARYPRPGVLHTLGPPPALEEATAELGGALYLAGDGQGALSTFETVVKERPEDARAVFFRGLAHQALGQPAAALNDYQFASRMAFAHPERRGVAVSGGGGGRVVPGGCRRPARRAPRGVRLGPQGRGGSASVGLPQAARDPRPPVTAAAAFLPQVCGGWASGVSPQAARDPRPRVTAAAAFLPQGRGGSASGGLPGAARDPRPPVTPAATFHPEGCGGSASGGLPQAARAPRPPVTPAAARCVTVAG